MSNFQPIRLLDPDCCYRFASLMANSADPDQLASSEANWSGSTLFAKQGTSRFSRTRVNTIVSTLVMDKQNKNSAEGIIAPAGAKVTGVTIRMWLLNKFISFLAALSWKTGLKINVDKVPSGAHIFQASAIPSNGYIFSTDFLYYTAQW